MNDCLPLDRALTPAPAQHALTFDSEQIALLKRTICRDASDDELALFVSVCQRTQLDPFARQIHAVKRAGVMTIQPGIDGFRLIAERTGQMNGQDGPFWCGADGKWRDVWLAAEPPAAAKIVVYRKGHQHPYVGIARFAAYCPVTKESRPFPIWSKMPDLMIAKCAEALALRKAFPQDLGGLYTTDEMASVSEEFSPPQPIETGKKNGLPADGAELVARLQHREKALVAAARCTPGELIEHVRQLGTTLGHPQEMQRWGADVIGLTPDWVRTFEAQNPISSGRVNANELRDLQTMLARKGKTWQNVLDSFGFPPALVAADLRKPQYAEIMRRLGEERDVKTHF